MVCPAIPKGGLALGLGLSLAEVWVLASIGGGKVHLKLSLLTFDVFDAGQAMDRDFPAQCMQSIQELFV